jgi:5'-nucleotidase
MIILIDQDGPLADFTAGFNSYWAKMFPGRLIISKERRKNFYLEEDYPEDLRPLIEKVFFVEGFYRNLPVVEGAIEAIGEMIRAGFDVRICTSPRTRYENCVLEKYQWVENNFGHEFTKGMIMTRDKTLVKGDYLIDDKPEIIGSASPEWEHLLFDYPYNQDAKNKRRINWKNWKDIIFP